MKRTFGGVNGFLCSEFARVGKIPGKPVLTRFPFDAGFSLWFPLQSPLVSLSPTPLLPSSEHDSPPFRPLISFVSPESMAFIWALTGARLSLKPCL